jgi:hypothetical protein
MKFNIDISVFLRSGGPFGHVSGTLELEVAPSVGDTLSFVKPGDAGQSRPHAFAGLLRVEERVISAAGGAPVSLVLEDLYFDSAEDAQETGRYLESGFGFALHVH